MNHDLLHVFVGLYRNDLIPFFSQYSGIMKRYLNSVKVSWDLSLCYPRIPNTVALIRRIFDSQILRIMIRYNSTLPSSKYSSVWRWHSPKLCLQRSHLARHSEARRIYSFICRHQLPPSSMSSRGFGFRGPLRNRSLLLAWIWRHCSKYHGN